MLETLKTKVKNDVLALKQKISNNKALIEKRSRKTLDVIAEDEKIVATYEADLEALEKLTATKEEKAK